MDWETVTTIVVLAFGLVGLLANLAPPDVVFLGTAVLLAACGVITVSEAFRGFANPGVLTVGALFVVAAGLRETGVLSYLGRRLLGTVRSERRALLRLALAVLPASAFVNNTPVVSLTVPMVLEWCRRWHISPSRLLLPVSYFAILGGICTLIGTSTNLIVDGLMRRAGDSHQLPQAVLGEMERGMGLFEITWVGVPLALLGTIYLLTIGVRLLPRRKELMEQLGEQRREYLVEMLVEPHCHLVGSTVEEAGLRHLPGLFLIEIEREGKIIAPVSPDETIRAGDRLVFTGIVSTIVDLEKIPGLTPAADSSYVVTPQAQRGRRLCEVVVSPTSPLVGLTIREANFRALYNAAVVAVHRSGERIRAKIGDIVLRPGDTLLLQVGAGFSRAHRNNPDFYLVSDVAGSRPFRYDRTAHALAVFALMVIAMTTGLLPPVLAAFLAAGAMVALRCISLTDARYSVDWQMLVAVAAALGVAAALEQSHLAHRAATAVVSVTSQLGPRVTLAALYALTVVATELITNTAAAALMFPIYVHAALELGVDVKPFLIALAVAASASFASPVGYQTNMIVYGPGGYKFRDFLIVGLPLNVLLWLAAVVLIPMIWPF